MTTGEVRAVLQDRLRAAGLTDILDTDRGQLSEFPDGFFAEVVLKDASKLHEAERAIDEVDEELRKRGTQLERVVRAEWKVESVKFIGSARSLSGSIKAALAFQVVLRSGGRSCDVTAEVTWTALERLRESIGIHKEAADWSSEGDVGRDKLEAAVREFAELQLSSGGTSYWDPLRYPRLELDEAAMAYLLRESAAFRQLRGAVDRFFSLLAIRQNLDNHASRGIKLGSFYDVLPYLTVGGSFLRGGPTPDVLSSYQTLDEYERRRLDRYYQWKVEIVPAELKREFAQLF
jgi:hypothetical protein